MGTPHREQRHTGDKIIRAIVPTDQLGQRIPEQGRIRLGVKTERAMKAITEFRFTSPDQDALDQLADLYGGSVSVWSDPKANPPNQFELLSTAKSIRVFLPPDALSIHYEMWTGGGVVRRCDGLECETTVNGPEGKEPALVPCICETQQKMMCKPHARLTVILPDISFRGSWRLETKGWNAVQELPTMVALIDQLQSSGRMTKASLTISEQTHMVDGTKQNYVVPKIGLDESPEALIEGRAVVAAIDDSSVPALPVAGVSVVADTEIVDAELVESTQEDEPLATPDEVRAQVGAIASRKGASPPDLTFEFTRAVEDMCIYIGATEAQVDTLSDAVCRTLTKDEAATIADLDDDTKRRGIARMQQVTRGDFVYKGLDDKGWIKLQKNST